MNLRNAIEQFPWNKFGTAYESNAKELKEKFLKILDGTATPKDYQYIIWRLEHQDSLYKLAPWGLKFYIALLPEKQTDKVILLDNIKTIFEAANYQSQVDKVQGYKPAKGNLEKYEWLKSRLFDADFDGSLPPPNFSKCSNLSTEIFGILPVWSILTNINL